jgi:anti-sigma factor RsiW
MSCGFSKEMLALHVEGDLSATQAETTSRHLASCEDCRRFFEELQSGQSLLKSLRRETISASDCTEMRRRVMSIIDERPDGSGWALRIERAITLGFRRHSYALAAFVFLGVVSVSALAQMRQNTPTLLLPDGYRDWAVVTPPRGESKVYIDPLGYREYAKTGRIPEGTVMIWEPEGTEPAVVIRHVTGGTRPVTSRTAAFAELQGCSACHS